MIKILQKKTITVSKQNENFNQMFNQIIHIHPSILNPFCYSHHKHVQLTA